MTSTLVGILAETSTYSTQLQHRCATSRKQCLAQVFFINETRRGSGSIRFTCFFGFSQVCVVLVTGTFQLFAFEGFLPSVLSVNNTQSSKTTCTLQRLVTFLLLLASSGRHFQTLLWCLDQQPGIRAAHHKAFHNQIHGQGWRDVYWL